MVDIAPARTTAPRPRGFLGLMNRALVDPARLADNLPHQITGATDDEKREALTASAARVNTQEAAERLGKRKGGNGSRGWQEEAWELIDLIGEQRFLANTLAGRMAQARFYVGTTSTDAEPTDAPEPSDDPRLNDLLRSLGGGQGGLAQIVSRMGVNLFVSGEGWIVGIPPRLVPGTPEYEIASAQEELPTMRIVERSADEPARSVEEMDDTDVLRLQWRMLSTYEVELDHDGTAKLKLEDGSTVEAKVEDLYLIRVWRQHPRIASEADSPTRASLPVLRELLGLTQMVSAQIDSRLAGAGILQVPTSVSQEFKRAAGLDPDDERDPLLEALLEAMTTAISDRASAAATVPIVVTVPDGENKLEHLSFSTPLDEQANGLRDEAIRRLALGQDAPPELLLGTAGMNHWGAWLVREDVVNTHLEPPLALIATALTREFLRPVMAVMGFSDEEIEQTSIWYDVDHLVARPNRVSDAKDLYDRGVISARALREATGFSDADAPPARRDDEEKVDPAVQRALEMVTAAPSLAASPGIAALVEQIREVLGESSAPASEPDPSTEPSSGGDGSEPTGGLPETAPSDDAPADSPAGGAQ